MIPLWVCSPIAWLVFVLKEIVERRRQNRCQHEWTYGEIESAGSWTGYIECCVKCGALQQIPQ